MKKGVAVFLFLTLLLSSASAEDTLDGSLTGVVDTLDLSPLPEAFQGWLGSEQDLRALISDLAAGREVMDVHTMLTGLLSRVMDLFTQSLHSIGALFIPAVLCSVLERMRSSFSRARMGEMLEYGCFLVIAAFLAKDLSRYMALCETSITRMAHAMQALFPLLLTLLSAVGGTTGAAFYQPAVTAAGSTMVSLVRSFTLKLTLGHGAVSMLSHLSDRIRLSRLAALLRQVATWTLGIAFTLFLSVTTLQGVGSAVRDGISIRAAKYAVDNFVPVVGGMFADTMDTLIGASLLVKNALGITGLIGLILLSAGPMLEVLCAALVYRLCAALMEIISPRRVAACVGSFASVLTLLFIIQLSVGAMFFLLVAQLLAVGNLIVMLR